MNRFAVCRVDAHLSGALSRGELLPHHHSHPRNMRLLGSAVQQFHNNHHLSVDERTKSIGSFGSLLHSLLGLSYQFLYSIFYGESFSHSTSSFSAFGAVHTILISLTLITVTSCVA